MFFAGRNFRSNAVPAGRILIVSAAAVALIAVAAWAFSSAQGPTSATPAAGSAPAGTASPSVSQTPETARPSDRAARGAARTPLRAPAADAARGTATTKQSKRPVAKKTKSAPRVLSAGTCEASYYWEAQPTASGERFNPNAMTAAHKTLPLGSRVRVTNKRNGDSVTVRINDRGPYIAGRCIDLSRAAMAAVGGIGSGVIPVRYEVLARG